MNEFLVDLETSNNVDDKSTLMSNKSSNKFLLETEVKNLINKISKLNTQEKTYILKLLIDKNIKYTKNVNGFFFNMYSPGVNHCTLETINESIDLMLKNRNILNDIDKKRDLMIKECKELIENQLHSTNKKKQNDYFNKICIKQVNTNITYNFSKYKKSINYKIYDNIDTIDKKNTIYNKNSVFFRLNTQMKLNTRQHRKSNNQKYLDNESNDLETTSNKISDDIIVDDVICDDDNYNNDEDPDYDECVDENQLIELSDNADINDIEEIPDIDDHMDLDIDENEIDEDNQRLFYKELLNKHGFIFNEDKDCMLIYQEYIN